MVRLIVALDRQRGIAKGGVQPWYIPADEQYFTTMTKQYGGVVVTGSTTYATFKGPLAERRNLVLSRSLQTLPGAEIVHSIDEALQGPEDVWVVGGAQVFRTVMDAGRADELFITEIDADFRCDQFFPEYKAQFHAHKIGEWQEENGFRFRYAVYKRQA